MSPRRASVSCSLLPPNGSFSSVCFMPSAVQSSVPICASHAVPCPVCTIRPCPVSLMPQSAVCMLTADMFACVDVPLKVVLMYSGVVKVFNSGTMYATSANVTFADFISPLYLNVAKSGLPSRFLYLASSLFIPNVVFGSNRLKFVSNACVPSYFMSKFNLSRSSPDASFIDSFFNDTAALSAV